jgi:hypothetical protein
MKNSFKLLILALFVALSITSCKKKDGKFDPNDTKTDIVVFNGEGKSIGDLIAAYKKEFSDAACDSSRLARILEKFLKIVANNDRFTGKSPSHIQPIYAHGIDGVAYYEVWFSTDQKTLQGWALISATEKDYPLVNYSNGIPYSSRIVSGNNKDEKVYRFGASYYTLEKNGAKTAEYGQAPKYIVNPESGKTASGDGDSKDPNSSSDDESIEQVEGVDYFSVSDYEALKTLFAKYYYNNDRTNTAKKMEAEIFSSNGSRSGRTADAYQYRYTGGAQPYYTQIPANSGFNPYACWSGCHNNAWANIYGWWDRNQAKGALIPTTSTGEASPLYRNTAARRNSIDPVQMYIRSVSGTYCGDGTGWTPLANLHLGYKYASYKGYGYSYQYQWCSSTGCNVNLANILTDGVANNYKPVYIAASSHAWFAYGWSQWDTNTDWTWAYCYPGWNENNNDDIWIYWHDFNGSVKMFVY